MAERVVRVRLSAAVQDYKKQMQEAADATKKTGEEAETAADRAKSYREAFNAVGTAAVAFGALLMAGFGAAVKSSMDFDAQMSNVQAATHESAENMGLLRQAALDAGESTVFSATESAAAIEELAKAGVSTADILGGGLTGALDLAAAGGLDVASAAEIAATAMQQFNLDGSQMSHVADLLAAGAGKAQGDVTDLAQALNQSALVAKQTGLSIEETTAGLSAFAAAGLLGSDAGTSFKTLLQSLTPTSAAAAEAMQKYNIEAYDAQGNFVGLSEYAGKLQAGLSGLSTEQQNATLKTVFGADAVRAATVLYQQGAEGISEWTDAVDDQGYAAETARMRLDNLKGDLEALGGAFETALIDTGSTANDTLRTMAQALTGLVGLYNDMPEGVQGAVMAIGGATAAVTLSGGAALLAVPKYLELKNIVDKSSLSMKGISLTAGAAGLALGGLFMIVGELAASHQRAQQRAQSYADALSQTGHAAEESARELVIANLSAEESFLWMSSDSAYEAAKKLGIGIDLVTEAAEGNAEAQKKLSEQMAFGGYGSDEFKSKLDDLGISLTEYQNLSTTVTQAVERESTARQDGLELINLQSEATDKSASSSGDAAEAYTTEADAISDLNGKLADLIQRINDANGVAVDAITANANYLSALDGLTAQAEKAGVSLDENTVSGSANAAAMGDLAEKARDAAEAQFEQDLATMSADEAAKKWNGTLAAQKQAFIDSATAAGYNADEVKALADRIFQMPSEKEIAMLVETAAAQSQVDKFVTLNNGRRVKVFVDAETGNQSFQVGSKTVSAFAGGGRVIGPGSGTSDDVDAKLSNGEHVIAAAEVRAAGGHEAVEAWRSNLLSPQSQPVYVRSGDIGGGGAYGGAPQPISLDGLSISGRLEIGGDGLARIIDGKIKQYDDRNSQITRRGVRTI
ncbi:MAG: phage tail tape measure protein [Microbacterium sp.]